MEGWFARSARAATLAGLIGTRERGGWRHDARRWCWHSALTHGGRRGSDVFALRRKQAAGAKRRCARNANDFHSGHGEAHPVPRIHHAGHRVSDRHDPIAERIDDIGDFLVRLDLAAHR